MSNPIVSFDEQAVKDELRELVRKTIEETINAMLDEEADRLSALGPASAPMSGAGHYERGFTTTRARLCQYAQVQGRAPPRRSSSATKGARRRSRRPSSRCTWPACRRRTEDVSEVLWGAGVSGISCIYGCRPHVECNFLRQKIIAALTCASPLRPGVTMVR